jgi:UDP-N-acetylglucosamine:LPS N-acetylglucosamine transferase
MKILFTGGGTMGPVTPLLAVFEAWKDVDPDVQGVWAGTPHGPEEKLL